MGQYQLQTTKIIDATSTPAASIASSEFGAAGEIFLGLFGDWTEGTATNLALQLQGTSPSDAAWQFMRYASGHAIQISGIATDVNRFWYLGAEGAQPHGAPRGYVLPGVVRILSTITGTRTTSSLEVWAVHGNAFS